MIRRGDYIRLAGVYLAGALFPFFLSAQPISVGVTVGVPISPNSQNLHIPSVVPPAANGQACLNLAPTICGPNDFFAYPYAIGANVNTSIRWGLSAEVGFLYERFHMNFIEGFTYPHGGLLNFGQKYSVSANAWLFPLLLNYTFGRRKVAPLIEAGATLRHLDPFNGKGIQLDFYLQPQPTFVRLVSSKDLDVAVTVGAGARWRISLFDVTGKIRFLHWTAQYYQPVQNQAMLMLGFNFPAHK